MYSTIKYVSALFLIFIWLEKRCDANKLCVRQLTVEDDGSMAWESIGDCNEIDEEASGIISRWKSEYERSKQRKSTNAPKTTADTSTVKETTTPDSQSTHVRGKSTSASIEETTTHSKPVKETTTPDSPSTHVREKSTSASIEETTTQSKPELCQVKSMNQCFWLEAYYATDVKFNQAEEICSANASVPAFIADETTYNLLVNHVRENIPTGLDSVELWTGILYDPTGGTATAKNGINPYLKWSPGSPVNASFLTHIPLLVASNPESAYEGMHNDSPASPQRGVICEA